MRTSLCVKKAYSTQEIWDEHDRVASKYPDRSWTIAFCDSCNGFHVLRMKQQSDGPQRDEKKNKQVNPSEQ
jgi:hypothetical protein